MKKYAMWLVVPLLAVCIGCSSGTDSRSDSSPPPQGLTPFPTQPLTLDFTLALDALVEEGDLIGIAVNREAGVAAVLNSEGDLLVLTLEGELVDELILSLGESPTDLAAAREGEVLIAGAAGTVWRFDLETDVLEVAEQLDDPISAVTYDDGTTYVLTGTEGTDYTMITIAPDGTREETPADARLALYTIVSADAYDAAIYLLAASDDTAPAQVLQFTSDGDFVDGWSVSESPEGLAILSASGRGPVLLTVNSDAEKTVRQFEPAPLAGDLDDETLEILGMVELGEAGLAQPSGMTFYEEQLFFVSDFGVVARAEADGSNLEILFEIDSVQGSFESIDVDVTGELLIIGADSEDQPTLYRYDLSGVLVGETVLIETHSDEEMVVEGVKVVGDEIFWVNHAPGQAKILFRRTSEGSTTEMPLGEAYDAFAITGLTVDDDSLFLLTDQREDGGRVLAGLIVEFDYVNGVEIDRWAAAGDEGAGLINPSGIAINTRDGVLYVAADTDEGELVAYDFDD